MDDKVLGAIITGVSSLVVALVGYATARRKDSTKPRTRKTTFDSVEQRLWAGVVGVVLALVVAEAVAPLWGATIRFPPQAYPFLVSGLVFWLYLSLSGKNGGDGKGQP